MMKKWFTAMLLLVLSMAVQAQLPGAAAAVSDPVKWSISVKQVEGPVWDVIFRADIAKGWYVYSVKSFGDLGPMPTVIALDTLPHIALVGGVAETSEHVMEGMDPMFDMNVKKFKEHALFTQRVSTTDPKALITGRLDYQTCDDTKCDFPYPLYFRISLADGAGEFGPLPFPAVAGSPGGAMSSEPVNWSLSVTKKSEGLYELGFKAAIGKGWYIYSQSITGDGPIPTTFELDSISRAQLVGKATEESAHATEGMDEMFGIVVRKFKEEALFVQQVRVTDATRPIIGVVKYMACNAMECTFPDPVPFSVDLVKGTIAIGPLMGAIGGECKYKLTSVDLDAPVVKGASDVGDVRSTSSLWQIFLLGFLGGLVALLTPCVFPMIPLTVSFFTKGSEDKAKGLKNALTYGGFILGIYLLFSLPFHLLGSVNAEIFNEISTNPWLNIFFFVIFLVFAVSFFGYFEITLPSSWVNSMDQKASKFGGLIGIFFMALTLALVSFSCTGPILGSLLAGALTADGGAWQLTAGLGGFGLALALPFALFALFPSWLNSLPRSGSWLNSVKVVLGFAEVALAFKFLSNADLVKQWLIVPYELFMFVWVLCALGIVLYLFGVIRFPHDSPVKSRSPVRWAFIGLFTLITGYLALGLRVHRDEGTFTSMALMSGLAPPVGYSWILPKKAEAFQDLEAALAHAREVNKPVMIDFTGWACVNCRKMEEHVWSREEVKGIMENDYVLASLYVDDKRELSKEEQHTYTTCTGKQRQILTLGNKWSTVQLETFIISSQPYYALLSPDGTLLTDPVGYTPDVDDYKAFLERGLQGMRELEQRASR
ncbi:MAG: thioredoxin family protein [Flavobacteriales bacterium]|nr:thioredoxin family protein [Flavobacteriales bacterium]